MFWYIFQTPIKDVKHVVKKYIQENIKEKIVEIIYILLYSFILYVCLESIKLGKCYNLITDKFDDDVINPCYTDIEILRASASIIGLLINSNQYISIQPDNEL